MHSFLPYSNKNQILTTTRRYNLLSKDIDGTFLLLTLHVYIYIYIYIYMCVCVCVIGYRILFQLLQCLLIRTLLLAVNAGKFIDGESSISQLGQITFKYLVDVASGLHTFGERAGHHQVCARE